MTVQEEYLGIMMRVATGKWQTTVELQQAVWDHSKHIKRTGTKWEGVGGQVRRLLQQHCSSWHHYRGPDLFVYKNGLYSTKQVNGRSSRRTR